MFTHARKANYRLQFVLLLEHEVVAVQFLSQFGSLTLKCPTFSSHAAISRLCTLSTERKDVQKLNAALTKHSQA